MAAAAVEAVPFHPLLPPTGRPEGSVTRPVVGQAAGGANVPLSGIGTADLTFDAVEADPCGRLFGRMRRLRFRQVIFFFDHQSRAVPVLATGEFRSGQRGAVRDTKRVERFATAGTVRQFVSSGASAQVAQLQRPQLRAANGEALLPHLIRVVALPKISRYRRILH